METSVESRRSRDEEQTNEDSDSVLQKEDNAKRATIASSSDTTLHDLPIELFVRIVVQAVAMEVNDMKLAKSVWKEKADPVIDRLTAVCSLWSSILTTDYFRNEVNRVLDRTDQGACRLEVLYQSPIGFKVIKVTATKDEIFLLHSREGDRVDVINVYDRNNMAEVKEVITLPRRTAHIAACIVSSCVYVQHRDVFRGISLSRITKDEEHKFNIEPWITDEELRFSEMCVSATGSLMIISNLKMMNPLLLSIYDANGSLQRKIKLHPNIIGFRYLDCVIGKSDGNFVVVTANEQFKIKLTEVEERGRVLRQYQSSLCAQFGVKLADIYGRIMIAASHDRIELLDSEFNLLDFAGPQMDKGQVIIPRKLYFNNTRNEIIGVVDDGKFENGLLTIFRLA